jgi:murein L,D-transpeptidase YcbB/YkuD
MCKKHLFRIGLMLTSCFITLSSCGQTQDNATSTVRPVAEKTDLDSAQISSFLIEYPNLKMYEVDIRAFYRDRDYAYVWFHEGKLVEQAGNLTNKILNLKDDGVFKQLSYGLVLDSLRQEQQPTRVPNVKLELLLTAEYFVYSNLVWQGMESIVSKENGWFLPRKKISYDLYLDSLLKSPVSILPIKEPVYRQYELLRKYLSKYRQLDTLAQWDKIPSFSKEQHAVKKAQIVKQVKVRLMQLSDYAGKLPDTLFDGKLVLALQTFQVRHGLSPSGKIDQQTLEELNVPLKSRIRQIIVNMERSRWLPITSESDYIAVNIPEFKMHVYHSDSLLWSANAVVGKMLHPTTVFYGEINQVVFSPYWNIPESIVAKEILPGIKKDPDYLAKHNMEITGKRNGLPVIRQKPGASNALGLVKFLFPNSYSIYLHDTPSKSLFNETARAFSHGCIRIKEPEKLAEFLLKDKVNWNTTSIRSAMHAGKERIIPIVKKVPVYIAYFTAFIDRDSRLNFRKDIYQLDSRLAATIMSGEGTY